MQILFTGSSSFTGYWILRALVEAGHKPIATFQRAREDYQGLRGERVRLTESLCTCYFSASTGSQRFCELIESQPHWDLWCHHGAHVDGYRSPMFDPIAALASNSAGLHDIIPRLKARGCRRVLLTGSLFAMRQGVGSDSERAILPYGLSKGLTHDLFSYYLAQAEMVLGHFVIANPFGPFEEERLTRFLATQWLNGQIPTLNTPDYVRDYMPVDLLARLYVWFAERCLPATTSLSYAPQGYVGSQRDFVHRFAKQMMPRLKVPCEVQYAVQNDYSEPLVRINSTPYDSKSVVWNEEAFWDDLAKWYLETTSAFIEPAACQ